MHTARLSSDRMDTSKAMRGLKQHYQKKKSRYKKKIAELQAELGKVQERLEVEEALNSKYFDCLEQQGLLCGICMEDIVQDEALPCCSNRLCQTCETKIAARHKHCPFCRTPTTTSDAAEQCQQAAEGQSDMLAQANAALVPGDIGNPFAAALRALMQQSAGHLHEDIDGMDTGSDEYDTDGDQHAGAYNREQDATVFLAAAAEAAMAASRGASGTCGLCNCKWLLTSLASAAELPGMLLCRSCWRNIPDLAGKPFVPAAEPNHTTVDPLFARNTADETGTLDQGIALKAAAAATTAGQAAMARNGRVQGAPKKHDANAAMTSTTARQQSGNNSSRTLMKAAKAAGVATNASKQLSKKGTSGKKKHSSRGDTKIKISTDKKIKKTKGMLKNLSLGVQKQSTKGTTAGITAKAGASVADKRSSRHKSNKKSKHRGRV